MPAQNFAEIAERIIETDVAKFAIAVADVAASRPFKTKIDELERARSYLKQAIVKALADAQSAGRRRDE